MWGKPASIEIQIPGRYAEFESNPSNSYLLSGAVRRFSPLAFSHPLSHRIRSP